MFPLLPVAGAMMTAYHVGKGLDNERYWNAYAKNHPYVKVKYPYRSGRYDTAKYFGQGAYTGFRSYANYYRYRDVYNYRRY